MYIHTYTHKHKQTPPTLGYIIIIMYYQYICIY